MERLLIGIVEDNNDPKKLSRLRIRVNAIHGTTDEVPTLHLPWAMPKYLDNNRHDIPYNGSEVNIEFLDNDIKQPYWYSSRIIDYSDFGLSDKDYETSIIFANKDLSKYNNKKGFIDIRFTESEGYVIKLKLESDKDSILNIRKDGSILLRNGKSDKVIHISDSNVISLGTENKSKENAVLGLQNEIALNKLNSYIKTLSELTSSFLSKLDIASKANPYTSPLSIIFKAYKTQLDIETKEIFKEIDAHIPKTKSEIVNLD